jgi:titin
VTATNAGGESGASNEVSARPEAPVAPAAPSGLVATATSRTSIMLRWNDNSSNEQAFEIERSMNGKAYTRIATVAANTTSFTNTGLAGNKLYYYRVRAINQQGPSAYSNVASARTPK